MQQTKIGILAYKDKEKILETMPIKAKGENMELTNQITKFFCEKLKDFDKELIKTPTNNKTNQKSIKKGEE